jgi:hypothetical protein
MGTELEEEFDCKFSGLKANSQIWKIPTNGR